jgi:hypothetical protein
LINKLKEAEVALKSSLSDNSVIKRQSENDHEVRIFIFCLFLSRPHSSAGDLLSRQQDPGAGELESRAQEAM